MNNRKLMLQKIESYLNGDLKLQDSQKFEKELKKNTALRRTYTVYKKADDAVELMVEDKKNAKLK